jgi:mRNA-degrading endonuclease RelE of RelBE toxin-antitoxin system
VTYQLAIGSRFERQLKRFYRKNPALRERVQETLRDLEADPFRHIFAFTRFEEISRATMLPESTIRIGLS